MVSRTAQPVPAELQEKFDEADAKLFQNVRAVFGGRMKHAVSGAAPIAPRSSSSSTAAACRCSRATA